MKRVHFRRLSVSVFLTIFLILILPFGAALLYVKADMEGMLRDEISAKVVQNLQKSVDSVNQLFSRMTTISNVFYWDDTLMAAFTDSGTTHYERYVAFNRVIRNMSMQNLFEYGSGNEFLGDRIKITFIDQLGQLYTSWSQNYQDYAYLMEQPWVRESMAAHGFMRWSMDALGYAPGGVGARPDQIALARTIAHDSMPARAIGTLLLSVDQQQVVDILKGYQYSAGDFVFVSSGERGVLLGESDDPSRADLIALVARYQDRERGNDIVTRGDRRYLMTFYSVARSGLVGKGELKIFYMTDYEQLDGQITALVRRTNILSVAFALLAVLIAVAISHWFTRPMRLLSAHMAAYRVGDEPVMLESGRRDEIGDIYTAYFDLSKHIRDLFARLKVEQITKEKYYYESLRSRMTPHFLFNTLNTIRWMALIRGADNIRASIDALAGILQYSLESGEETVTLARELEIVEAYCLIQNVRFGNACQLTVHVPDELRPRKIIKFILQPAVENCFKHAFKAGREGGAIDIEARRSGSELTIEVSDDGCGFPPETIAQFAARRERGIEGPSPAGIGLKIVDERIRVAFGDGYGIELKNNGRGACVIYHLPVMESGEEAAQ